VLVKCVLMEMRHDGMHTTLFLVSEPDFSDIVLATSTIRYCKHA